MTRAQQVGAVRGCYSIESKNKSSAVGLFGFKHTEYMTLCRLPSHFQTWFFYL